MKQRKKVGTTKASGTEKGPSAMGDAGDYARDVIAIENVRPELNCGRFPVKRTVGDVLEVSADIFKSGRDVIRASLRYRKKSGEAGTAAWREVEMELLDEDRWTGRVPLDEVGVYEYAIDAWTDEFATTMTKVGKWLESGEDVTTDMEDLRRTIESTIAGVPEAERGEVSSLYDEMKKSASDKDALETAGRARFSQLMERYAIRKDASEYKALEVVVDRRIARFAAWYEMFHRSQGIVAGKSATFEDCARRLPEIRDMGFDVVYLPPLHPIGVTNRRGRNNSSYAGPDDPGSPWAIGNETGGHTSINPELGGMEQFQRFLIAAQNIGIEVAIDLAFQASPDHPYVKEHPEWFFHRSDGSIRYAENPPKKYPDVYPLDFQNEHWRELWEEALRIVLFWVDHGVNTFRVDNPHTKPLGFWEWLIRSVKEKHPGVIFLAEAFTRPKVMKALAKLGFSQSYTYFAWKNTKDELTEFLTEFVLSDAAEYYRGNFFTNTPDILPAYLQDDGRPAFKIRAVLASTLSSLYGIYNGFELCENRAVAPGSEEYLDSEKYQYKVWDWERTGNIKDYIRRLNAIRRANPSLQVTGNLTLLPSDNDQIFFYGKWTADRSNIILVAVNLDPFHTQEATVTVPIDELGIEAGRPFAVVDLITSARYTWQGERNYVKLDPSVEPAHVLRVER